MQWSVKRTVHKVFQLSLINVFDCLINITKLFKMHNNLIIKSEMCTDISKITKEISRSNIWSYCRLKILKSMKRIIYTEKGTNFHHFLKKDFSWINQMVLFEKWV